MRELAPDIATVTGSVPASELGIVAMRETVLFGLHGWEDDPRVAFDPPAVFQAVAERLEAFRASGGKTLVEGSGALRSGNARMLADLARSTGVQIIASTGLGREDELPGHFRQSFAEAGIRQSDSPESAPQSTNGRGRGPDGWIPTADNLAELFYGELIDGMAVDGMMRSSARAGLIRTACGPEGISPLEELTIQGAALAARRTGVPVVTDGISQARRHVELLVEAGLAEDRIVVGHCDDGRDIDPERDREMAERGVYVAFDHIGWEDGSADHAMPDGERAEMVKSMVESGFAERLILSGGAIGHGIGGTTSPHGFTYLLDEFVPRLAKAGVGESTIHTILVENPGRLLSPRAIF